MSDPVEVGCDGGSATVPVMVWPPDRQLAVIWEVCRLVSASSCSMCSVPVGEVTGSAAMTPGADALLAGCVPETAGAVSGADSGDAAAAVLAAGVVASSMVGSRPACVLEEVLSA
jgi:hypothetical protein